MVMAGIINFRERLPRAGKKNIKIMNNFVDIEFLF